MALVLIKHQILFIVEAAMSLAPLVRSALAERACARAEPLSAGIRVQFSRVTMQTVERVESPVLAVRAVRTAPASVMRV